MSDSRDELFYYRDCEGNEVDFVFKDQAFEVKIKQDISSKDIKGLLLFARDYGAKLSVICNATKKE
jgi:predicted AAA+ superfamily ATPase